MRLLLRIFLLACSVLLLSGVGVVGYFLQDQAALIERGESYFERKFGLSLSIGTVDIPSWRNYPAVGIVLRDVAIQHPQDTFSGLSLHEIQASIQVVDFWTAQIRLDSIQLASGQLAIDASDQLGPHLQQLAGEFRHKPDLVGDLQLSIHKAVQATISDVDLSYRDKQRAKHMAVCAKHLGFSFDQIGTESTQGAAILDLWVDHLTFNPTKGSYLEQTRVRMEPDFTIEGKTICSSQFDLRLNEELFQTQLELGLEAGGWFYFDLRNTQTPFQRTIRMVPQVLRQKLQPYQISRPLAARIRVRGGFAAGDNPLARIDFQTSENHFAIQGYPGLNAVATAGYLVNRASADSTRWADEHPLNLRLHFDQFEGQLAGTNLQFEAVDITFTPQDRLRVGGRLSASGQLEALNPLLEQSAWSLNGGSYQLQTQFAGPIRKEADIPFLFGQAQFSIHDTELQNKASGFGFSIETGSVVLVSDTLHLKKLMVELPASGEQLKLEGRISHVASVLKKGYPHNRESVDTFTISSSHLSWEGIEEMLPTNNELDGAPWESTLSEMNKYFHPHLTLLLDTFRYAKYQLEDVLAKLEMTDSNQIRIRALNSTLDDNDLQLSGLVSLEEETPRCDLQLEAEGPAAWFNSLFANNTFFFEKGRYQFSGRYVGQLLDREDIVRHTVGELEMTRTNVLVGPTKVQLPLNKLRVSYDGTDLQVRNLRIPLPDGSPIDLSGEVNHFHHLLTNENSSSMLSSSFALRAKHLSFQNLQGIFTSVQQAAEGRSRAPRQALKPSLQTLYDKFHPCLTLEVDTFWLNQFYTTANTAQVSFLNGDQMAFRNAGFEFKGRPVQLSATVDIDDEQETPFELAVETERFDLAALVETYDYFGLTSLQHAEKVAGKVSLKAELQGKVVDSIGLAKDRLLGRIIFNLHEAELVNFAPIQEVANKFFRTERLHTIRFAPITDTLLITHRVVHIPRMEIQSTAFNLFVEGHLNYDDNTNIWVSLPWQNLRSWQEGELPEKTGYAQSGGKLFVEITEVDQEMKYRLRLTNKRLYRHRGIPEQYRIDKRQERAIRRAYRQERRRAKRIGV